MSDNGYRSIEIQISNYVNANLRVQGASATEAWVDGEEATVGQELPRDSINVWGAKTDDSQGSATFTVNLAGLGGITITATNIGGGRPLLRFSNISPDIFPSSELAEGSTANHTRVYVTLYPVARSWAGK